MKAILSNYSTANGKGMPLGNLTSQFFANVYLNELDQFVKKELKAKQYIRYVDDFVIVHNSEEMLHSYKEKIDGFLARSLALTLHPDKSRIIKVHHGVEFLGVKIFCYHKLIKKKNLRKCKKKFSDLCSKYKEKKAQYDQIYDFLEGWNAYVHNSNTYKFKKRMMQTVEETFPHEISAKEVDRLRKHSKKRSDSFTLSSPTHL